MIVDRLYDLAPLQAWPSGILSVVGSVYRDAAGEGLSYDACLRLAISAYTAAGGDAEGAGWTVPGMIASLAAERAGWLWAPAQSWLERQARAVEDVPVSSPGSAAITRAA